MPLGVQAEIDAGEDAITMVESAVVQARPPDAPCGRTPVAGGASRRAARVTGCIVDQSEHLGGVRLPVGVHGPVQQIPHQRIQRRLAPPYGARGSGRGGERAYTRGNHSTLGGHAGRTKGRRQ